VNAVTQPQASLPAAVARRGIDEAQWNTLCNSLFPGAKQDSILMVIDYCRSRQLDPLKKPCHIVPMEVKQGKDYVWRDVVMPGIYEHRTTAMRTGLYLGHSKPEYGEVVEFEDLGVSAPEWCEMTVYRWNEAAQEKTEFPVRVYFDEVVATKFDKESRTHQANARWKRAPRQMLTKCTEAAALREAFPHELGGEQTREELEGRVIDVEPELPATPSKPRGKPATQAPKSTAQSATSNGGGSGGRCNAGQIKVIKAKLDQSGIPENEFLARYEIGAIEELPFDAVNDALQWIANPEQGREPGSDDEG
jgi:phage recombination protein Bet